MKNWQKDHQTASNMNHCRRRPMVGGRDGSIESRRPGTQHALPGLWRRSRALAASHHHGPSDRSGGAAGGGEAAS
jgi:hypothetical protein